MIIFSSVSESWFTSCRCPVTSWGRIHSHRKTFARKHLLEKDIKYWTYSEIAISDSRRMWLTKSAGYRGAYEGPQHTMTGLKHKWSLSSAFSSRPAAESWSESQAVNMQVFCGFLSSEVWIKDPQWKHFSRPFPQYLQRSAFWKLSGAQK